MTYDWSEPLIILKDEINKFQELMNKGKIAEAELLTRDMAEQLVKLNVYCHNKKL